MKRMDKGTFIANAKRENETYKVIIEAINTLTPIAKKYNGKVINKRFVDAVNKAFDEKGYKIPSQYGTRPLLISLDEYNRIYFSSRNPCNITIYPDGYDKPYIIDKRMDYSAFEYAIDKTLKSAVDEIAKNEKSINTIDDVIQGYQDLKKYVKDFMDALPFKFRTFPIIDCPVYLSELDRIDNK